MRELRRSSALNAHVSSEQERCPPILEDFLYVCDDAYTRAEMIAAEMDVLRTVDFELGIPLSYRFLRRYAKVQVRFTA